MKLTVPIGSLKNEDSFHTILTGYYGKVINANDPGSVEVSIETRRGRERKRLHPDVKVYIEE